MPGPRLSIGERDFIQAGLWAEMSCRGIAAELGRSPSTVSREIQRNRGLRGYRTCVAHYRAHQRARRPKAFKLERHPELARCVERLLRRRWSPEQVSARLRRDHPDDPRWWVSPEAIYRTLYVQARGTSRPAEPCATNSSAISGAGALGVSRTMTTSEAASRTW